MKSYNEADTLSCLSGPFKLSIMGDSMARDMYATMSRKLGKTKGLPGNGFHEDQTFKLIDSSNQFAKKSQSLDFYWDPYLNRSLTSTLLTKEPKKYNNTVDIILITAGRWHLKNLASEDALNMWSNSIDNIYQDIERNLSGTFRVVLLPLPHVDHEKLNPTRKNITNPMIDNFNRIMSEKLHALTDKSNVIFPSVIHRMVDTRSLQLSPDGLHLDNDLKNSISDIFLNYFCNKKTDRSDLWERKASCCVSYGPPTWKQIFFVIALLGLISLSLFRRCDVPIEDGKYSQIFRDNVPSLITSENLLYLTGVFMLCFVVDRTDLFQKGQKQFNAQEFTFMVILSVLFGILTLKKGKSSEFLNRDITDEWKGWMQVLILIYHYTGASKALPVYNFVRILVSSYLFLTGYGHAMFFIKKFDFGSHRVFKVLVRLNLLSFGLSYIMDSPYQNYYFAPLVSIWFIIILSIMKIQAKHNSEPKYFVGKLILSVIASTLFFSTSKISDIFVYIFAALTGSEWNSREFFFRMSLEKYIAFVGIFVASIYISFGKVLSSLSERRWKIIKFVALILSTVTLVWYFIFESSFKSKTHYNRYHPIISAFPILALLMMKNLTSVTRSYTSELFVFIGRISLETFILQFHLWMALDTHGLLLIIPYANQNTIAWYLNFFLATSYFIFISWLTSESTRILTDSISIYFFQQQNDNPTDYSKWIQIFRDKKLHVLILLVTFNYLPE